MTKIGYKSLIALALAVFVSMSITYAATGGDPGTNTVYINSLPYAITDSGKYLLNVSASGLNGPVIEILADNVTLDGNGHYIEGDYIHNGFTEDCGVRALYVSGLMIKDMNISGLASGICFMGVSDSTIFKNNIPNSDEDGIGIYGGCENIMIEQNSICECTYPLYVSPSFAPTTMPVTNVEVVNNEVISSYFGIAFPGGSTDVKITSNNVINNTQGIYLYNAVNPKVTSNNIINAYQGMLISSATNAKITANNIVDALWLGMGVYNSENCDIHGNKISSYGTDLEIIDNIDLKESGNKYNTTNII
ncbi:right-handed parallel beta-helix repeat-containing protein [Methanococcus sp. CF]